MKIKARNKKQNKLEKKIMKKRIIGNGKENLGNYLADYQDFIN